MAETFTRFDAAEYLTSPEVIAAYLEEAAATGEAAVIARALGAVARARNFSELARETGVTRAGLHKALSGEGNPSFDTVVKVGRALGMRVRFEAVEPQKVERARRAKTATVAALRSKPAAKRTDRGG
ncbi:hypothetical protein sos41_31970 [Alphaproteobacteria bacterium SO-S41]|nr:hypothetical protein sos41_31970 [Alphaproteobacteria bacterium SO-S41]